MNLRQLLDSGERLFSAHPHVALYFPSAAMENARKRIKRAIDRGDGPALVVGAAGTGKSLLLQALAAQYHERFDIVLLACASICTRRALLQSILFELGLPYQHRDEGQLRLSLLDHLLSTDQSASGLLILVDEAQSLSVTLLEELRVMTNLVHGGLPRVRLVLAGSSALEENFAHPELESFSQRFSARCYLSAFGREETAQFVRAQLAAAGAAPEKVFASDTWDALFDATDGVPRLVNQLCDRALLLASEENCTLVDRQLIQAAWADLQQLPMPWESPRTAGANSATSPTIEFGSLTAAPSASSLPAVAESADVGIDDGDVTGATEIFPWQQTAREKSTVAAERPPLPVRAPRDPADPFAEEFDEEEVVLDNFAAWDEIFHHHTPRVKNQRDSGLSTLVEAAAAAKPTPVPRAAPTDVGHQDRDSDELVVDELDLEEIDVAEDAAMPDGPPANWPRLRLADLSESAAPDAAAADAGPNRPVVASPDRCDAHFNFESPILIIEDESSPINPSAPPVRRLAYQHLFSRLRSG